MRRVASRRIVVAALLLATATAVAQEPARRTCSILPIAAADAPHLDGWLDDACWQRTPEIGDLLQVEPLQGAAPTERTVVRLLHDETHIYLAIECFDSQPDGIRATQRARDAELDPDDRVEWLFDTFTSRRNAYWFQIGAAGSLGDALVTDNGARFLKTWDTIWDGRSQVTARGWQAEVAIPFRSLAFAEGSTAWGFNLRREHRRLDETDTWANASQASSFFRIGEAGTVTGFGPRQKGIGLELKPYVALREGRQRSASTHWADDPDAGLDLSLRVTPGITASFTTYTDFAETEVDDRQVNLTRFPLFFPEKRDFFLADATRFDFGPSKNQGAFLPYFSRRIGLDGSGREIPILAGLKVAGQEGPWEIGLLDVETDAGPDGLERQNLGVLRLKRQIGAQGSLGVIGTVGDPSGAAQNGVVGVDWNQREPEFLGGDLRWSVYGLMSQTAGSGGDGAAYGADFAGQTREWQYSFGGRVVDDGFHPALGFVRRTGVEQQYAALQWRPRPHGGEVRNLIFGVEEAIDLDRSHDPDDLRVALTPFGLRWNGGDEVQCKVIRRFERIETPFDIVDGVIVPSADYWSTRYEVGGATSVGRPLSLELRVSTGQLYDGESHDCVAGLSWRTGALLILGASYSETRARLPGGDFIARVGALHADLHFTPRLSWRNLGQYDSESQNLGVQSRVRWILAPGSDLFVVLSGSWQRQDGGALWPDQQQAAVKLVHTLRF